MSPATKGTDAKPFIKTGNPTKIAIGMAKGPPPSHCAMKADGTHAVMTPSIVKASTSQRTSNHAVLAAEVRKILERSPSSQKRHIGAIPSLASDDEQTR